MLRSAVARVAEGGSAFVLVVGEPGIGKSTLLAALSDLGREAGLAVGFGRGLPEGAVPLWPWRSALQSVTAERGHGAGELSFPLGELDDPDAGRLARLEGGGAERFAIFERFAGHLTACAAHGPIALLLDDLQWAEVSLLRLLRHLVQRPALPGVLIAGALRTTERLPADGNELVSDLTAQPVTDVAEVSGVDEGEVAAFAEVASARRLSGAEIRVLAGRSGGNPFLLGELLRWVPSGTSALELDAVLPLAVRESVRRRLVVEEAVVQRVVKAAAVAWPAASPDLLARVLEVDRVELAEALDAAVRAGLLAGRSQGRGSVAFVHDLVREAVLSMLPTWDRIILHVAVGTALANDVRSSSWAAVAAHLMAARPLVDDATLADVAHRAADEAARVGAFDEAANHLAVALEVTQPAGDTARRGALLWERGRMLWAAERADESEQVLDEAAALARRTGDGDLLACVALSWRGGELRAIFRHPDHRFLALLREALTSSGPGDSHRRCLLLSTWARCAFWDIGDSDAIAACDDGVAMARRLGDPEVLIHALGTRFYYRWRPELARERLAIADEMLSVAVAAADPRLIAEGSYFRLLALLDLGWLRDAWSELDRFDDAVAISGQPLVKLRALWLRAARHLAMGDRLLADEVAGQASGLAERMGRPDAAVELIGQRLVLLASEGRPDDAVRLVSPGVLGPTAYNAVVALANGLGGRPAEARESLDAVVTAGLERFPRDMSWLFTRCGLLAAAAVSGDAGAGQILYDALGPFAGQWAVLNPGVMVLGVVDHYLGLGAAMLGRLDEALDHRRRAAAIHENEGAVALALLSLHELETALGRRDEPGDDAEAARARRRIAELAVSNTVPFVPLLAIAWSAGDAVVVPDHRQCLVLEGDIWLVEFAGGRVRLRDQRGLHHLRAL